MDAPVQRSEIMTDAGLGAPVVRSRLEKLKIKAQNSYRRNIGTLRNPEFWGLTPKLATGWLNPSHKAKEGPLMFVGTHHKAMTTYFVDVMRLHAMGLGIPFDVVNFENPRPAARMFVSGQSKMDLKAMRPYKGVHVMRDPRDMIVSGYHYHKWTTEAWVHRKDENGRTYQEKLLEADADAGIYMEINHFIFSYRDMLENWDLDDPDMLEVSFSGLMGDGREQLYHQIFDHLGFEGKEHEYGVRLMRMFEAKKRAGKSSSKPSEKSHVRSAKSGQWKGLLQEHHLEYIDRELGTVLEKFGYT